LLIEDQEIVRAHCPVAPPPQSSAQQPAPRTHLVNKQSAISQLLAGFGDGGGGLDLGENSPGRVGHLAQILSHDISVPQQPRCQKTARGLCALSSNGERPGNRPNPNSSKRLNSFPVKQKIHSISKQACDAARISIQYRAELIPVQRYGYAIVSTALEQT
jgi:hypothetical protein